MSVAVLIVAAGRGLRAGGAGGVPKQYALLDGEPMLGRTLRAFTAHPRCDIFGVVVNPADENLFAPIADAAAKLVVRAHGGATRQESVWHGLLALEPASPSVVLIHDAARPFVDGDTIDRVLDALDGSPCAVAATPLSDTLKRAGGGGLVTATLDRENLWRAETPQGFHFAAILDAHRKARAAALDTFTDDAALAEWAGLPVRLVPGSSRNFKITTADDLAVARRLTDMPREPRSGTGFDVHKFRDGDHVWLCGVRIPHDHGLEGHSDADVGLHALTDALLGAVGDGDIGDHFPPSDPKWRGAASSIFLRHAARRIAEKGGIIANVDVTLLCESPKIAPYRIAMRETVAALLGVDVSRASVKATTTETLGFVGRREGLAAMASATVLLPP